MPVCVARKPAGPAALQLYAGADHIVLHVLSEPGQPGTSPARARHEPGQPGTIQVAWTLARDLAR